MGDFKILREVHPEKYQGERVHPSGWADILTLTNSQFLGFEEQSKGYWFLKLLLALRGS